MAAAARPAVCPLAVRIAIWTLWDAAGYPWSHRLNAMLPLWLPWAVQRFTLSPASLRLLQAMSPRTMDRALHARRQMLQGRLCGRPKPGALLTHHIPLRADRWEVTTPGFTEIDLVSHAGPLGDAESLFSLHLTDVHATWVETRAVHGKTQRAICAALDELRQALPFPLRGIDSDNGSELITGQLRRYCRQHQIQITRGRPYEKDDDAHIEQQHWTHVRRLPGWDRYDAPQALAAMNELYRHERRLMVNLFQPSVKRRRKTRVGSRLRRVDDCPHTPLDRLLAAKGADQATLEALQQLRARLDPFALADTVERNLRRIYALAHRAPIHAAWHPLPHQRFEIRRRPTRSVITAAR